LITNIIFLIKHCELDDVTSTFEDLKTFLVDRIEDDGDQWKNTKRQMGKFPLIF